MMTGALRCRSPFPIALRNCSESANCLHSPHIQSDLQEVFRGKLDVHRRPVDEHEDELHERVAPVGSVSFNRWRRARGAE